LSGAASSDLSKLRGSANVKLCIIKHMVHASAPPTGFSRTGSLQEDQTSTGSYIVTKNRDVTMGIFIQFY